MSKGGGAGKVYFVLYLAVVLELLIIIVERDEAEEHLRQRQKEAMKIVQSILSQMQSGAGTEGMNTRPQDEITIPPSGVDLKEVMGTDIKPYRQYIVEVGVTDVTSAIARRELESEKEYEQRLETLVKLANVQEIQYQIFYNPDENPNNAPPFPTEDYIKEEKIDFTTYEPGQTIAAEGAESDWEFLGLLELKMDHKATYNSLNTNNIKASDIKPIYPDNMFTQIGPLFKPDKTPEDSVFYYSPKISRLNKPRSGANLQKRAFVVNFEPPAEKGWYKLRFFSRTNRILGVKGGENIEEISDETTVNIGTVQLSVGDLRKVYKELRTALDEYELPSLENLIEDQDLDSFLEKTDAAKEKASSREDADEVVSRINLYGYICKLLAPGQSVNFDQNSGTLEFNVRVLTPKPPTTKTPKIFAVDTVSTFDQVPGKYPVAKFTISPFDGKNKVSGVVKDIDGIQMANIIPKPIEELSTTADDIPIDSDTKEKEYIYEIDKKLEPGDYTVEIIHELNTKTEIKKQHLKLYETALTKKSTETLMSEFETFLYYGYVFRVNIEDASRGNIRGNQFRIYVKTDDNPQRPAIIGKSVTQEDSIYLKPESRNLSLKVAWNEPFTGEEITLFDKGPYKINMEQPKIYDRNIETKTRFLSDDLSKIEVTIENLGVEGPTINFNPLQKATVNFNIGNPKLKGDLSGYTVENKSLNQTGDSYTIVIELKGRIPDPYAEFFNGSVDIPVTATATHPIHGDIQTSRFREIPSDKIQKDLR